jgi:hypothetical protein
VAELARVAGALCAAVVAVGVVALAAGGLKARLLEIQLETDARHVKELIDDEERRRAARRSLAIDYAFIAGYVAAFVTAAVLIARRGGAWTGLGVAATVAAIVTAVLDVLENLRTAAVLGFAGSPELPKERLEALRRASLAKWGASAVTVGLLAGVFLVNGWPAILAAVMLGTALLGLAGLRWDGLIPWFFGLVCLVTVVIAVLLLVWPTSVTGHY